MKKLIIITGQTATGKTKLALQLAQKFKGDLINCDSRQIYRYLNIITGKNISISSKFYVTDTFKNFSIGYYLASDLSDFSALKIAKPVATKLWLFDIICPDQYFSSFDYCRLCLFVIKKIFNNGKIPIVVGGSYFYLYHLLYGIETENFPPNWQLRRKLAGLSVPDLQKKLRDLNKKLFAHLNRSEKNNPQRLIRKIELAIYCKNHKSKIADNFANFKKKPHAFPASLAEKLKISDLKVDFIGLKFKDKQSLKNTIENRVEQRLKNGAVDEVKSLLSMGYLPSNPGLQTIGYPQIINYLNGKLSRREMLKEWKTKEIQYAKRQYTFMKKDKNILWREV